MKKRLLTLLIFMPLISMAQSNFNKGYIVNNAQDTLKGFIDYTEQTNNPISISFKPTLDGKKANLSIKDYLSYTIDGLVSFQRFVVNISMDKAGLNSLSTGIDTTFRRDTVFLKVLFSGKNLTFFSYKDLIKERFYIKSKDDHEPRELVKHDYFSEKNNLQVVTNRKYATQLLMEMGKLNIASPAYKQKVKYLNYTQSDMIKAAAILNEQEVVKSKFAKSRFFAGTGISINRAEYGGTNILAEPNGSGKTFYGPLFTAGIDLFANPAIGKLIYRVQVSFSSNKNEVTENNPTSVYTLYRHSFDSYTFSINPQIIYNVYNGNKIKVFIAAGFSSNISGYSNSIRSREYKIPQPGTVEKSVVKFERLNFSIPFAAGVVFNKRVEISAGYSLPASIAEYQSYNIKLYTYRAGISYLFGKH